MADNGSEIALPASNESSHSPHEEKLMDIHAIQKFIDAEKPIFDYARMFTTTVAWWTIVSFTIAATYNKSEHGWYFYAAVGPTFFVAVLFGVTLSFRLYILTEKISDVIMAGHSKRNVFIAFPVLLLASIFPVASVWLLLWASIFPHLPS
jgi:hypothetical protein